MKSAPERHVSPKLGPSILLIDPGGEASSHLTPILEMSGLVPWPVNSLEEAPQRLLEINPPLIALADTPEEIEAGLSLLHRFKTAHPYRQTLLFTDRTDPEFLTECLVTHLIDHVVPLAADAAKVVPQVTAIVRTMRLVNELRTTNHQLSKSSKTDSLTGLYNRGHIMEWLGIEHKRARRDLEPLCGVMIDLDHFKFVNDTYGHAFGDFVLSEIAQLLRRSVRDSDIVGRYGGEEFLILAPKTNAVGGRRLADKLRRVIEKHVFSDQVFEVHMTASFGLATSDHVGAATPEGLLQLADKALFEAKEAGRNRVVAAVGETGGLGPAVRAELGTPSHGASQSDQTVKVLVLDDSPLMVEMLSAIVRSMGLEVISASDGLEGLEIVKETTPDLILLDVNMPGLDGYQFCRQLRAMFRQTHIPVIFVTSDKGLNSQLQGYESGADDYLTKPVVREHLIAKIQAQLRVKSLHDRLQTANAKLKQAQRTAMRAERLKAIGQMAAGVAHDFNNVLSAILAHAQSLKRRAEDPDFRRGLESIESIVDQGAETIRRLLCFAQPRRGRSAIALIDLGDLLKECLQITRVRWRDEAEKQGVVFGIVCECSEGLSVRANPYDLREVFTALILNALDAMPQGGKLSVRAQRGGDSSVLVEVNDTGVGIPSSIQRKIFDPFFTTKPNSGAGLGLSVAYGIINRLGGRIECLSRVGEGSTFRVNLPMAEPLPMGDSTPQAPAIIERRTDDGMASILVVDDEPHIRNVLSEILSECGHSVTTAANGELGVEILQTTAFDIVLTDLGMPGMSGWEVARQARRLQPSAKVVLTSGWGNEVAEDQAVQGEVDAFLPKPVSMQSLLDCVNRLMHRSSKEKSPETPADERPAEP
ncbi:response regulator [Candidatus Sumerlaeota bacterium]|nr:response regulator [Candidatus Sumerlaeota bacterium]